MICIIYLNCRVCAKSAIKQGVGNERYIDCLEAQTVAAEAAYSGGLLVYCGHYAYVAAVTIRQGYGRICPYRSDALVDMPAPQGGLYQRAAYLAVFPVNVVGPFNLDVRQIVVECFLQCQRIGH